MDDNNLRQVLIECRKSAQTGYKIASAQEKNLNRALSRAQEKVQETIIDFNSSSCDVPEAARLLEGQLDQIKDEFNRLSFAFREDIQNLYNNIPEFSITLFGRTMAGKSTLMEILTEGDGSTIGKGAQRTTRDVRKYRWNGLEITDVPGIGAFEGEDDEQIAFEAAKTADLILFLITDDAPQEAEAECFYRIVNLGKPILCIMNVKASISENNVKLAERDVRKRFDMERLNQIRSQFLQFSERFGQKWNHIPFVYVHLKSAYVAIKLAGTDAGKTFYDLSRIDFLKQKIVEQVRTRGEFYRIKTFIDIISNPILESMENLLEQSQANSTQGRIIVEKRKKLNDWKNSFYSDGEKQIHSLIVTIRGELNEEIALFAEEHFDDKHADREWDRFLKSRKIEERSQKLLEDLVAKCNNKLKEVSREITNEIKFTMSYDADKSLRMRRIVDGRRIWDWAAIGVGGVLSVAYSIACLVGASIAGPLGWAVLAVTVIGVGGSFLFQSRESKENDARTKLEKNLRENTSKICGKLERQLKKKLNSLVQARIDNVVEEIDKINSALFKLADTQKELAWGLNQHLLELNSQILTEAIRLIGAEGLQYHVQSVARIPGNTCLLLLRDGTVFPTEQKEELYALMSERITFVYDSEDKKILISRILGREIDRSYIKIEKKIGVAHIPLGNASPNMRNRVRLAQQLSELLIMNQ